MKCKKNRRKNNRVGHKNRTKATTQFNTTLSIKLHISAKIEHVITHIFGVLVFLHSGYTIGSCYLNGNWVPFLGKNPNAFCCFISLDQSTQNQRFYLCWWSWSVFGTIQCSEQLMGNNECCLQYNCRLFSVVAVRYGSILTEMKL